jgi:hypothetical protein
MVFPDVVGVGGRTGVGRIIWVEVEAGWVGGPVEIQHER